MRAAADTDAYANLYFEAVSASAAQQFIPKLTLRDSSSPVTAWTKTFNPVTVDPTNMPAGLFVKRDGTKILAWWYDQVSTKTFVVGYSSAGSLLFAVSLNTQMAPQASEADLDLRRLFLVLPSLTFVLDGATGALVKTLQGWYPATTALAVGPNGDSVAIGNTNGSIDFYRTGASILGLAYTIPGIATHTTNVAALSADGSTLVVGCQSNASAHSLLLRILSIGAASASTLHQHNFVGTGSYPIVITDLAESRDGSVVAVATSGDQVGSLPSVAVFHRQGFSYSLDGTALLPGSALDLDLSSDGRILAVASSMSHYSVSSYFGAVDAFDLGGDLSVTGIPHAGTSVVVEQKCAVGSPCVLLVSDALAASPTVYPGLGSLLLATPVRLATAIADGEGVARFNFILPSSAAWYGHTYYTQGLSLSQRKLTTSYAPITVVP